LLTLGQVGRSYQRLVQPIRSGQKVLDIGCGTGALSLLAAEKGAVVKGIDINPEMPEIAQQRAAHLKLAHQIEFQEKGVAELESEPEQSRDVVMSGLCFSELNENELDFALKQAFRILKSDELVNFFFNPFVGQSHPIFPLAGVNRFVRIRSTR
jgi:ubiquinone/menaquinone biosynthesis C-methylase UbiE